MKRFSGCKFGPMELRKVLRLGWSPGERIIGWNRVAIKPGFTESMLITATFFVPGIGHAFAALLHVRYRRFVVLTDRRLILLSTERSLRRGFSPKQVVSIEIADLTVSADKRAETARVAGYELAGAGLPKALTLQIPAARKPRSARFLRAGMQVLAR